MKSQMSTFGAEVTALVKAIQMGQDKTEELYKLTFNHLELVAFHYLFIKSYLEDVMSEAYLKIFTYIRSADTNNNCYNWMCKIVQNIAYDFNKKYYFNDESIEGKFANEFTEIEDYIAEKSDLIKILKDLSPEDRQLIYYRFFEDLSYGEIAEKVNLKKNHIYKRIRVLIKKISKKFNNYGND